MSKTWSSSVRVGHRSGPCYALGCYEDFEPRNSILPDDARLLDKGGCLEPNRSMKIAFNGINLEQSAFPLMQ